MKLQRAGVALTVLILTSMPHSANGDNLVRSRMKAAVVALAKFDVFCQPVLLEIWDSARYVRVMRNGVEVADVVAINGQPPKLTLDRKQDATKISAVTKATVSGLLFAIDSQLPVADGYSVSGSLDAGMKHTYYSILIQPSFWYEGQLVSLHESSDWIFVDTGFRVLGEGREVWQSWVEERLRAERRLRRRRTIIGTDWGWLPS